MIISRTPLRISFFGGGTDYPLWYTKFGGSVLSTTIDKYSYITARHLPPFFDYKYKIRYYLREETKNIEEIKHPVVRESLKYLKYSLPLEIVHHADLPARSGLGSSSTFTVGLLKTLYALNNKMIGKRDLALKAINLEQNILKENVGSQDQVSASFGGFNKITFGGLNKILVEPIILRNDNLKKLETNLMLFFTGFSRTASKIVSTQLKLIDKKEKELILMSKYVDESIKILNSHKKNIDDFGLLLSDQWKLKKSLSPLITNSKIDQIYNLGIKSGALGGKLLGAGGGGFILFYVPKKNKKNVRAKLKNFLEVPFEFEYTGSQIIYYS